MFHLPVIPIVFENQDLLVVDKPPSIPSHPCGAYNYNSIPKILELEQNKSNLKSLHRLDKLTSGLLLFGKSIDTKKLQEQFSSKKVGKMYLARVGGEVKWDKFGVDKAVRCLSKKNCRWGVEEGQPVEEMIKGTMWFRIEKSARQSLENEGKSEIGNDNLADGPSKDTGQEESKNAMTSNQNEISAPSKSPMQGQIREKEDSKSLKPEHKRIRQRRKRNRKAIQHNKVKYWLNLKPSVTLFSKVFYDSDSDTTLLKCFPKTGRTHQIRVHLDSVGHSIINDVNYNGRRVGNSCFLRFRD